MMALHLRGVRGRSLVMESCNGLLEVLLNDYQSASCGYHDARKILTHVSGVEDSGLTKRGILDGRCYAPG